MHNILDYGAVNDGKTISTEAFEKAVSACRKAGGGTVFVPAGEFLTGPINLTSNLTLHLEAGSVVRFIDDFDAYPPVETRWGGASCYAFSPLLFGKGLQDVEINGRGVFDGQGKAWWDELKRLNDEQITSPYDERTRRLAELNPGYENTGHGGGGRPMQFLRPPLLQLLNCSHVRLEGVTFRNSPFWNTHIVLSNDISVHNVRFENPEEAPNGDGLDIDSSTCVRVSDCYFDVGDDCLCLKSGVDGDGRRIGCPTEDVAITNCTMRKGHGGVVMGSENAGDIRQVVISNCIFDGTERGIRVKSRRGRGGVIEDVRVNNLIMRSVGCPLVISGYYWCGTPADRKEYIASAELQPKTEETPHLRNFCFAHLTCRDVKWAAGVFWGLPEAPIEGLYLDDVIIEMDPDAEPGMAEGAFGVPNPTAAAGIMGRNLKAPVFKNLRLNNVKGEEFRLENSDDTEIQN